MKIYLFVICISILWSCDNRKDPYFNMDPVPLITVEKLNDTTKLNYLSDSMKIGNPYVFKYNIISSGNQELRIEKNPVSDSVEIMNSLVYVFRSNAGISTYMLQTTDPFNKSASLTVQITYFINLPPVCEFTVSQPEGQIPYVIDINASASYDQDARWGGKIVNYQYAVGSNYEIQTVLDNIQYVCDGPGQKKISVSCQDDNGAWSVPKTIYYNVSDTIP